MQVRMMVVTFSPHATPYSLVCGHHNQVCHTRGGMQLLAGQGMVMALLLLVGGMAAICPLLKCSPLASG